MPIRRCAILLLSLYSFQPGRAGVAINWSSASGAIKQMNGTNAPSTWTAQLIWSPDDIIDPVNPAQPYLPTGGEIVLRASTLNPFGVAGRIGPSVVRADNFFVGGFVYTRVFDMDYNNGNPWPPTAHGNSQVSGPLLAETTDAATILNHRPAVFLSVACLSCPFLFVYGNDQAIPNGQVMASAANHTDFGWAYQSGAALLRTFRVVNTHDFPVDVGPFVLPAGFEWESGSEIGPGTGVIHARLDATFTVRVPAGTDGNFAGRIEFANSDPNGSGGFGFNVAATIRPRPTLLPQPAPPGLAGWHRLAWPADEPVSWRLESSEKIGPDADWTPVASAPSTSGPHVHVDIPSAHYSRAYFRIVSP